VKVSHCPLALYIEYFGLIFVIQKNHTDNSFIILDDFYRNGTIGIYPGAIYLLRVNFVRL